MVNKENHYLEYKGDKNWLSLISSHFAKSIFLPWNFVKSIRKLQYELWYKLISLCKHYLSTSKIPI